ARALVAEAQHNGAQVLVVQPPVLAPALRAGADHRRRRDAYDAVLALPGIVPPDPTIVLWALSEAPATHAGRVDAPAALAAARAALDAHDYRTGVELSVAAQRAGLEMTPLQQAELALVAGSCLRLLDRVHEAAVMFERSLECLRAAAGPRGDDDEPGGPDFTSVLIDNVTARADLAHYRDRGPENSLPLIEAARGFLTPGHPAHSVLDVLTVVHLSYAGRYREAARAHAELGAPQTDAAPGHPAPLHPASLHPAPLRSASLSAEWERRLEAIHALALDALGQSDAALAVLRRLARQSRTVDHHAWASEEYLAALLYVVLHGFGVNALFAELAPFVAVEQD
ncbi:MAG: hypothetical protein V7768_14605, partial [Dietzia cercidiphylli]